MIVRRETPLADGLEAKRRSLVTELSVGFTLESCKRCPILDIHRHQNPLVSELVGKVR